MHEVQRRSEAEQEHACAGRTGEHDKHPGVDGEVEQARGLGRRQRLEQAQAGERETEAERRAQHRQRRALDQQLTHESCSRRAERHPHRHLAVPGGSAHQQQVGDVRAGDEKHQRAGADEGEPDRVRHATEELLIDRDGRRAKVAEPCRCFTHPAHAERFELRLRLRGRVTGAEPTEDRDDPRITRPGPRRSERRQRRPDLGVPGELETLRHDADDGRLHAVEGDGLAQYGGSGAVARLPEPMTDECHGGCSGVVVVGAKVPPQKRRDPQRPKRRRGHGGARHALERAVVVPDRYRRRRVGAGPRQHT